MRFKEALNNMKNFAIMRRGQNKYLIDYEYEEIMTSKNGKDWTASSFDLHDILADNWELEEEDWRLF